MFRFGKEIMEKWYKIKGYKDIVDNDYEVSDKGRVRKTSNRVLLKQSLNIRGGYPYVTLYSRISMKSKTITVHSLMKYYIFRCRDNKIFINHIDGDKTNNDIINLELSNPLHNTHHAIDLGLFKASKVEEHIIEDIRKYVIENKYTETINSLKEKFNISEISVCRIIDGSIRNKNLKNIKKYLKPRKH